MTTIFEISQTFRTAIVGGYVRDLILGVESNDSDYVVEASVEEFEKAFPGLEKVGNNFPVYLVEGNEIALTRIERSTGSGYTDFEFEAGVSIEEDLGRRDFTINSIGWTLLEKHIDPLNGIADISNKLIRTVNKTAFIEDPLRILRGVRFAVRFGFTIEEETKELMKQSAPLLETINPERIEKELRKVYEQSEKPGDFFRLLDEVNGLIPHFQELWEAKFVVAGPVQYHPEGDTFSHLLESFDRAKASGFSYEIGIAALVHDIGKITTPEEILPSHIGHDLRVDVLDRFLSRHRFSAEIEKLARITLRNHMKVHDVEKIKKHVKVIRFVRGIDRNYFDKFIQAANCDATLSFGQIKILETARKAIKETKIEIPKEVQKKGTQAIKDFVEQQYTRKYMELIKS